MDTDQLQQIIELLKENNAIGREALAICRRSVEFSRSWTDEVRTRWEVDDIAKTLHEVSGSIAPLVAALKQFGERAKE